MCANNQNRNRRDQGNWDRVIVMVEKDWIDHKFLT